MEVLICENCELIQSFSTKIYVSNPEPSMSCDADRSSIRYTKDLVLQDHLEMIKCKFNLSSIKHFLDVGSNRGAFTKQFILLNDVASIDAVEPNDLVTEYLFERTVRVHKTRFEFADLLKEYYDFIYIAHTLEHLFSAAYSLEKLYDLLIQGGCVFIAVPNSESIVSPHFEEQFIDTHTFHFTKNVLINKLRNIGFHVEDCSNNSSDEICLFAFKQKGKNILEAQIARKDFVRRFYNYSEDIEINRSQLIEIGVNIKSYLKETKVIFWGAGRIFDGMIRLSSLNESTIKYLIDKTLCNYVDSIHGVRVQHPKQLLTVNKNFPVVICSRVYAQQIREEANKLGFFNVWDFTDFMKSKVENEVP